LVTGFLATALRGAVLLAVFFVTAGFLTAGLVAACAGVFADGDGAIVFAVVMKVLEINYKNKRQK
jgi:hypothetical protein